MREPARPSLERHAGAIAAVLATAGAAAALVWLTTIDPTPALAERRPGMDGGGAATASTENVIIGEIFQSFDGSPGGPAGVWPGFRGVGRDNVVPVSAPFSARWGTSGPAVLWSVALGEGHAGPAVADGRVFLLDYDEEERADVLRCFSLGDGRELWRRGYHVRIKRNHGFSRTVPAVAGGVVVTLGPRGHVMAVDAEAGDLLWALDLEQEYGTEIPLWYTGQCPLIDQDVVILAPAGAALLVGLDARTGDVLWSVPNPDRWGMSHTSVVPMTLDGRRMYVYSALGGMVAVEADGEDRGRVLWTTTLWTQSVLAPTPLVLPGGRLFVTAGYGAGSMLLQVAAAGDGYSVTEVARFSPAEALASEQQTPILFEGRVFGIQPKDAGALRNQLVCYRADDVTRPVWSSGPTHRFGLGPYLVVGDRLVILDDDGTLTLAEATSDGYRQLAQARVFEAVDAWAPMALVGNRLLLRDLRSLLCLEIGTGDSAGGHA
jgi:outer membrane protein assembly factor BamB